MPEELNFTPEMSPLDTVLWWFISFLFGSSGTIEEAIVTFVVTMIVVTLAIFYGWRVYTWFSRTHQNITKLNSTN